MSAYENLRKQVEFVEAKGETELTYSTKAVRNVLSEIDNRLAQMDKLKKLVENIPLQLGDVVHETGHPIEKGDVVKIEGPSDDPYYTVMIRHRRQDFRYYREELELMERQEA